ncbi:MAG TPA: hypothetical protein VIU86_19895 [Gaiellaceae bacterium]
MAEIETLTSDEIDLLLEDLSLGTSHLADGTYVSNADVVGKAVRILGDQVGRIAELDAKHTKARHRIAELEAQITASETVSRAEYDAMVKQRDTLRQERNTAIEERDAERLRVGSLREALEAARDAMREVAEVATLGSLREAIDDIEDALGLSDEEPQ